MKLHISLLVLSVVLLVSMACGGEPAPTPTPTLTMPPNPPEFAMNTHTLTATPTATLVLPTPMPPTPVAPTPAETPTFTPRPTERLAWSKQNVYDPETDTYYIPYHLWTGAYWDGNKNENVIPHSADTVYIWVNRGVETHIKGPEIWRHPYLDKEFKVYRRTLSDRDK